MIKKTKSFLQKVTILSLISIVLFSITACRRESVESITITFDAQGGSLIEYIELSKDASLPELPIPEKDGYIFGGWTSDLEDLSIFDVTDIDWNEETLELYAMWTQEIHIDGTNVFYFDVASITNNTIELTLIIGGDVEFVGYDVEIVYDSDLLRLLSYNNILNNIVNDNEDGVIRFNYVNVLNENDAEVAIITLEFEILSSVSNEIVINVIDVINVTDNYDIISVDYEVQNFTLD